MYKLKIENPYEGIVFYPSANKFSATLGRKTLGYFDSLDEAIGARREAKRTAYA